MTQTFKPKVNIDDINFTTNWNNKLDCDCFSTFRMHNQKKYFVGAERNIKLKGKFLKRAKIMTVTTLNLSQVTEGMALIDTGYPLAEFKETVRKIYKNMVTDFDKQLWDFMIIKTIKQEVDESK